MLLLLPHPAPETPRGPEGPLGQTTRGPEGPLAIREIGSSGSVRARTALPGSAGAPCRWRTRPRGRTAAADASQFLAVQLVGHAVVGAALGALAALPRLR